MIILICV